MTERIANLDKPKTQRAKTKRKPGSPTTGAPKKRPLLLGVETTGPRRRGGKPPGRKPAAKSKSRKTPPGRAAERLRNSVNSLVSRQSDEIAQALIKKTKAGNMTGARILVELSGADQPPDPVTKKPGGLKLIDLLESDTEWDPDSDPDEPHPGCEWNGDRWVRPEPKPANPNELPLPV